MAVDFASSSRLILPIPPSVNHAYHNVAIHRRIKTETAKAYITEAGWTAKMWAKKAGWTPPPLPTPVIMSIWIYWPDHRRRDPDNLLKILLDSLAGVLWSPFSSTVEAKSQNALSQAKVSQPEAQRRMVAAEFRSESQSGHERSSKTKETDAHLSH